MRFLTASVLLLTSVLAALPAHALKSLEHVTPKSIGEQGFTLSASRKEDGMLTVRVTRDPAKARWTGRSATLELRGATGILARCELEAGKDQKLVTYRFDLSPESFRQSYFTVAEVQTGPGKEALIGGGTFYEFHLADFADAAKLGALNGLQKEKTR